MAKAPHVSPYLNPVCPYCCGSMKRNGKTRNGKQRYRCSHGCFNETENSVSPNSNVRTGYGTTKRKQLTNRLTHTHNKQLSVAVSIRNKTLSEFEHSAPTQVAERSNGESPCRNYDTTKPWQTDRAEKGNSNDPQTANKALSPQLYQVNPT